MKEPKIKDLKYDEKGTKETREYFKKNPNPKVNVKVKITMNLDEDLLQEIRRRANKIGAPYQTYMNKILREALETSDSDVTRIDKLEREVQKLKDKVFK